MEEKTPIRKQEKIKANFWNNAKFRAYSYQTILVGLIGWIGYEFSNNAIVNMEARGIQSGFDFLSSSTGFAIIQTLIEYSELSTYWTAFLVALINTLVLAIVGIFFATILGFIIGVLRLSKNWLVAKLALSYIELFRNIPLLLQIFFWYHVTLKPLPSPKEKYSEGELVWFSLSNSGIQFPSISQTSSFNLFITILALIFIGTILLARYAKRRQELTGKRIQVFLIFLGSIIIFPLLFILFIGQPLSYEPALMGRFRMTGGSIIIPEYIAMLIALSVYTASFIAEIVRSGINAVSHGQTEAAKALDISTGLTLRLIVLPQALRVIVPPLTNQYLNLTKNSSLATAVAYPELVSVFAGIALNQTGRAFEILTMTLLVYLLLSLITSLIMNWYNKKIAIVER